MVASRSRTLRSDDLDLATFVVEDAGRGAGPLAALEKPVPSGGPVEDAGLPLEQMRLAIEDGLLMVFGPEGDPVPPQLFATAAAARPDARLALPDGMTTPASRVAAALRAQILGRLGMAERSGRWILAMLREDGRPEPASEDELRAERKAPGTAGAVESAPTVADAGIADGAPREGDRQNTSGEQQTAAEADAAPGAPQECKAAAREALDRPSLDWAAAYRGTGDQVSGDLSADGPAETELGLAQDGGAAPADEAASAPGSRRIALGLNPQALAADGFHALVIQGVPAGAELSAGTFSPAMGGWMIRPQDLATLAILPPPDLRADFTVTLIGIALRPGDANAVRILASLPVSPGPRMIGLGLDPQALAADGFHALMIRDVPAGAELSAGTYSPAIDGWMIQLQDLATLAILPPPDLRADFTVTLIGIALRPGDANAVRVLASLPVTIA